MALGLYPCAFGAKHESQLWRDAVFDGFRQCHADGQANKFPVRRHSLAQRFTPFATLDTKRLAASRKRPLRGLHEKSGCRRSELRPSDFVSVRVGQRPFRVRRGGGPYGTRQWRGLARGLAHLREGGPCRTAAKPPSAETAFVFRAERLFRMENKIQLLILGQGESA